MFFIIEKSDSLKSTLFRMAGGLDSAALAEALMCGGTDDIRPTGRSIRKTRKPRGVYFVSALYDLLDISSKRVVTAFDKEDDAVYVSAYVPISGMSSSEIKSPLGRLGITGKAVRTLSHITGFPAIFMSTRLTSRK